MRLERIRAKLARLRALGKAPELGPTLELQKIEEFERELGICIPLGYRRFLLEIGSGGSLAALVPTPKSGHLARLEFPEHLDTDRPAPEQSEVGEQGQIVLRDEGCGTFLFLVVTGSHRGSVWLNWSAALGRTGTGFDYVRSSFLSWFELELDRRLPPAEVASFLTNRMPEGARTSEDADALNLEVSVRARYLELRRAYDLRLSRNELASDLRIAAQEGLRSGVGGFLKAYLGFYLAAAAGLAECPSNPETDSSFWEYLEWAEAACQPPPGWNHPIPFNSLELEGLLLYFYARETAAQHIPFLLANEDRWIIRTRELISRTPEPFTSKYGAVLRGLGVKG